MMSGGLDSTSIAATAKELLSESRLPDDLRALRDLGVCAVDIDFERSDPEDTVAEMRRFKEQVISQL